MVAKLNLRLTSPSVSLRALRPSKGWRRKCHIALSLKILDPRCWIPDKEYKRKATDCIV